MSEHVVVVGGGIAGTVAALALRTAGIAVTVIEARPKDHGGGAVVRLNPNGMDALRAIGAHQPVISVSFPLVRSEFFSPSGERVRYRLAADPASERGLPRVLAWPRLSQVLHDEAVSTGAVFRHDARVVNAEETAGGVRAVLGNGDSVEGDVLIGADGVRSTIRPLVDSHAPAPQHLGTRTVYGYTPHPPCEPPPPEVLRAYGGKYFFAITRNSFTGGCFWFTSLPAPEPAPNGETAEIEQWRQSLLQVFGNGYSPAAPIVEHADRILAFDDYASPHLPRWHTDRMIVIGDAAHVAPPASEQGAAMAIEDGVVLAQCLRDAPTTSQALAAFEQLRRERVEAVVALGQAGTSRAHARGLRRLPRLAREKITKLAFWRPGPFGGPAWALDHHIDWNQRIKTG
ncbi:MAG: FAD-dependent oxidoreductase [Sciscionella sp.]